MHDPWTHTVDLRWRPELRFFDQRIKVLETLEAQDDLIAFHVSEGEVGALMAPGEWLMIRPGGATLTAIGPDVDLDRCKRALALVIGGLRPSQMRVADLVFQFVDPLVETYEEARAKSAAHVLPGLKGASILDYAVLLDGRDKELDSPFKVEFGIINSSEALGRITRMHGKMQNEGAGVSGATVAKTLPAMEFPDVAFFSDWRWQVNRGLRASAKGEDLVQVWAAAVAASQRILGNLQVAALDADVTVEAR